MSSTDFTDFTDSHFTESVNVLRRTLALVLCAALGGCREREPARAPAAVDSNAYAPATLIARFRARVGDHPAQLGAGAAESVDVLLARYVRGVERADTAALAALALTEGEFAWLYYVDSPMARPPYELDPETMWSQIRGQSARGLERVLARYGGRPAGARGWACAAPQPSGAIVRHDCSVTLHGRKLRLGVVERDARFKLVGLGTDL